MLGHAGDPRHAAVRRVRQRIPDHHHRDARLSVGDAVLLIALGIAFAAIFGKMQPIVFGETTARRLPHQPALIPVFAHLLLVLILGLYIPHYLAGWYRQAAALMEDKRMPIDHLRLHLTKIPGAIPAWSGEIGSDDLRRSARTCRTAAAGWWHCGAAMTASWVPDMLCMSRCVNEAGLIV